MSILNGGVQTFNYILYNVKKKQKSVNSLFLHQWLSPFFKEIIHPLTLIHHGPLCSISSKRTYWQICFLAQSQKGLRGSDQLALKHMKLLAFSCPNVTNLAYQHLFKLKNEQILFFQFKRETYRFYLFISYIVYLIFMYLTYPMLVLFLDKHCI